MRKFWLYLQTLLCAWCFSGSRSAPAGNSTSAALAYVQPCPCRERAWACGCSIAFLFLSQFLSHTNLHQSFYKSSSLFNLPLYLALSAVFAISCGAHLLHCQRSARAPHNLEGTRGSVLHFKPNCHWNVLLFFFFSCSLNVTLSPFSFPFLPPCVHAHSHAATRHPTPNDRRW